MILLRTKECLLSNVMEGCESIDDIKKYERVALASEYLMDRKEEGRDPVIDLDRPNINMLRGFLDVSNEVKLSQLQLELADAIIAENHEELEDMFEQEYSNFNFDDNYRREVIYGN